VRPPQSPIKLRSSEADGGSSLLGALLATAAVAWLVVLVAVVGRLAVTEVTLETWANEAVAQAAASLARGTGPAIAVGQAVPAGGPLLVRHAAATWHANADQVGLELDATIPVLGIPGFGVVRLDAGATQDGP
jgi:hypothetical protein